MTLTLQRDLLNSAHSVQICPITQHNYLQAVKVLAGAFVDDPISVAVYPKFSIPRRIDALQVDFKAEVRLCMRRGYPILAQEDSVVLGAAVIYAPGGYPFSRVDQWKLLLSSILGNGLYNVRDWMHWLDEVDKHHPAEPHFYLEYIAVEPGYQGMGVGSALLQHLVDKADGMHVGCYLENTNPRNVNLYQRFGFNIIDQEEIIGVPNWFMWRPPAIPNDHT